MNYYLIAPAKSFNQSENLLTYESADALKIGHIVEIPFGKQSCIGIVVAKTSQPTFVTKAVQRVIYPQPLPRQLIKALDWLTDYYRCPMSAVVQAILPRGITKRRRPQAFAQTHTPSHPTIPLNSAQKRALRAISDHSSHTVLLHGITGSGKTNIYLKLAQAQLSAGKSVILLVPEIALTSQLVHDFRNHFADLLLIHSGQSESLRHQIWQHALQAEQPQVVIGPRSALFTPVKDLGLIIIDEAHEPSYQQDQNPKYSALRLASIMAKTVLGTATPLISDYYICHQHDAIVPLDRLALPHAKSARLAVIDLKNTAHFSQSRLISTPLLDSIKESLTAQAQTMIFHNRRGTAPLTICDHCGWQALCPNCYLPMTLHADTFTLRCHSCGHHQTVPTCCPDCHNPSIRHKGFGTKYLETELQRLFPRARIARFDADTAPERQLSQVYEQVRAGNYDIIIGTQGIAKGFDFPHLRTLGVVQADAQLALPDFASEERTFQLLTQVLGRARRGHQDSEIFIQTYQPDHPIINFAIANDYAACYKYLLQKRQQSALPPFSFLLKFSLTYKTEKSAVANSRKLYKKIIQNIQQLHLANISATPPLPAFHERSRTGFTWEIIVRAKSRHTLLTLFDAIPKSPYLHFELDPISLL
ncbi:primosomal protein N' [Candidatus Saccharibacteria bacterium]|nr:primosomal protein N' [Candidatus Saccharibacteria bacterium]